MKALTDLGQLIHMLSPLLIELNSLCSQIPYINTYISVSDRPNIQLEYSGTSVIRMPIFRNYRIFRRRLMVRTFFTIIFCKNVTDFSNFNFSKKSVFRTDQLVPIKETPIKIPC